MTVREQAIHAVANRMAYHRYDFVEATHGLAPHLQSYVDALHEAGGRPWRLFELALKLRTLGLIVSYSREITPYSDEHAEALRALICAWRERQYARRMTGDETTPLPCGAV